MMKLLYGLNLFKRLRKLEKAYSDRESRIENLIKKYPYPSDEEEGY
jgi:hypothetical protein